MSLLLTSFSINFDIISITESWLNVDNNFVFDILDYNTVLSSRVHKRGGGVIIAVKKIISFNILSLITNKLFDSIIIELILNNNKKIIFSFIYRTPNICKNAEIYLEKFHELGCSPMINRPTRIDLNKNYFNIIDNFFTNLYCAKFSSIIISDLSDHFPIILSLDIHKSNRLNIVNKYNTKHNLINDVICLSFFKFVKNCQLEFFKN